MATEGTSHLQERLILSYDSKMNKKKKMVNDFLCFCCHILELADSCQVNKYPVQEEISF